MRIAVLGLDPVGSATGTDLGEAGRGELAGDERGAVAGRLQRRGPAS